MTKVYIIESELGWGKSVEEVLEFDTEEEAEKFCREYNRKYNPPDIDVVPDWYMYAEMEGQKEYGMLR